MFGAPATVTRPPAPPMLDRALRAVCTACDVAPAAIAAVVWPLNVIVQLPVGVADRASVCTSLLGLAGQVRPSWPTGRSGRC